MEWAHSHAVSFPDPCLRYVLGPTLPHLRRVKLGSPQKLGSPSNLKKVMFESFRWQLTPRPIANVTSAARIAQSMRPVKASIAERRSRLTSIPIPAATWADQKLCEELIVSHLVDRFFIQMHPINYIGAVEILSMIINRQSHSKYIDLKKGKNLSNYLHPEAASYAPKHTKTVVLVEQQNTVSAHSCCGAARPRSLLTHQVS